MATYTQLHDGNPDGVLLGRDANDLWAAHGATPTDQPAYVAEVAIGNYLPNVGSTGVVFSSTAQMSSFFALVEAIRDILVEKGLMASS